MNKDIEYIKVPIYIEKAIKKLLKLKNDEKELLDQIRDYMSTHNISKETPLSHLKYFPDEKVCPGQLQMEIENK